MCIYETTFHHIGKTLIDFTWKEHYKLSTEMCTYIYMYTYVRVHLYVYIYVYETNISKPPVDFTQNGLNKICTKIYAYIYT